MKNEINEIDVFTIGNPCSYAVGQPESTRIHISPDKDDDLIQYMVFKNRIHYPELMDYKNGDIKLGLFLENDVLFILIKFGAQEWCDLPFEPRMYPSFSMGELEEGEGYAFLLLLAEVQSGILKNIRMFSLGHEFSNKLKSIIEALSLKRTEFDMLSYLTKLERIRNMYTTRKMVSHARVKTEIKFKLN